MVCNQQLQWYKINYNVKAGRGPTEIFTNMISTAIRSDGRGLPSPMPSTARLAYADHRLL